MRTGTANLPLHGGKTPPWLFRRMKKLAKAIVDVLLYEYSQEEFLRRISDPYWFQALSCVLGFDWHSSGTTTTTCGALKEAIRPDEHGMAVAGGKGRASRRAPDEIISIGEGFGLSGNKIKKLLTSSRLAAKVDNALIQDGYQLYHHSFFFTENGKWAVVQQGMNGDTARRYHWLSDSVNNFVEEPHQAICCDRVEKEVLDLTARGSRETREASLELVREKPNHLKKYMTQVTLSHFSDELRMPRHHKVRGVDIDRRGWRILRKAYELQPESYEELISLRGFGPKTIRALALLSDLLYGTKASWKDPVKYSFAHGGKDGFPYPVDKPTYDETIRILMEAIESAKVGNSEKYGAIRRLKEYVE